MNGNQPTHSDNADSDCPPNVDPAKWELFLEVLDFLDRLDEFEAGAPWNTDRG